MKRKSIEAVDLTYLARAILVAGAIVLVYQNGIFDVIHDYMLEKNICSKTIARPSPSLNSQSIFGTRKCSGFDCNISHTSLLGLLAQTSNATSTMHAHVILYSVPRISNKSDIMCS
jgi:hypothetical protein